MNIVKTLLEKFKENPIKTIGLALTYLGIALILVPILLSNVDIFPNFDNSITDKMFLCFLILIVVGPFILIISWVVNKELRKQSPKLISIGVGWLVISVLGVGYWLANIMIWISLTLIALGIILPIIAWIINKINKE